MSRGFDSLTTQISGWSGGALFRLCLVSIFDVSEPTIGKSFSDSSAFGNVLGRKHAEAVYIGAPDLDQLGGGEIACRGSSRHGQTATGALIAA